MIRIETLVGNGKEIIEVFGKESPVNYFFARFINNPNGSDPTQFETYILLRKLSKQLQEAVRNEIPQETVHNIIKKGE